LRNGTKYLSDVHVNNATASNSKDTPAQISEHRASPGIKVRLVKLHTSHRRPT